MTNEEKIAMLEELLDVEDGTLTEDMVLKEIPEYDSVARLSLIVLMEDEFGLELDGSDIRKYVTVGDILAAMVK